MPALPRYQPLDLHEVRAPFDDSEWIFELKLDGLRALAYVDGGACRLVDRNDRELREFASLRDGIPRNLLVRDAILDGEIVVLDAKGRCQFGALTTNPTSAVFAAFDLLWLNGVDLRGVDLMQRKASLQKNVRQSATRVLYVSHVSENGRALYREARARDMEGIVAKPMISAYRHLAGRSPWLAIRNPKYSKPR